VRKSISHPDAHKADGKELTVLAFGFSLENDAALADRIPTI